MKRVRFLIYQIRSRNFTNRTPRELIVLTIGVKTLHKLPHSIIAKSHINYSKILHQKCDYDSCELFEPLMSSVQVNFVFSNYITKV